VEGTEGECDVWLKNVEQGSQKGHGRVCNPQSKKKKKENVLQKTKQSPQVWGEKQESVLFCINLSGRDAEKGAPG